MSGDRQASELLRDVVRHWHQAGPLTDLELLIPQVWRTNVERHDPEGLGDDAMSLGLQSARNIMNRAVRELAGRDGVEARGGLTLEVRFAGRVLHVGKAPAGAAGPWTLWGVDWSASDVRDWAARVNSGAYQPVEGTLLEELPPLEGQRVEARGLTHLHLLWQGTLDGHVSGWLGFPSLGPDPWFAVEPLFDTAAGPPPLGAGDPARPVTV